MRVFMPTANQYTWYAEATAKLMARYWPTHPIVDVVHFEQRPRIEAAGFHLIDFGRQADCRQWIDQFGRYLADCNADELVFLTLDDYGLFQPPDEQAIATGCELLSADDHACGFCLTWQPTHGKIVYVPRVIEFSPWSYSINTQAGIWRRELLLNILRGAAQTSGPWDFEIEASQWFHGQLWPAGYRVLGWDCPDPSNPSPFVDSVDKTGWAYAYHNLCRRRQRDPRHQAFLEAEGLL